MALSLPVPPQTLYGVTCVNANNSFLNITQCVDDPTHDFLWNYQNGSQLVNLGSGQCIVQSAVDTRLLTLAACSNASPSFTWNTLGQLAVKGTNQCLTSYADSTLGVATCNSTSIAYQSILFICLPFPPPPPSPPPPSPPPPRCVAWRIGARAMCCVRHS